MSSLPTDIESTLNSYESNLNDIETQLDLLLNVPNLRDYTDTISPMESAQLYTTLAYTLNSLYHSISF